VKATLVAGVGVLGVVLAIFLLRAPGRSASARPAEDPVPRRSAPPARAADPDLPWPERDPFRYAEERRPTAASAPPPIRAAPSPPPVATANPLRLIGVVRKGGTVKAAVSLWGETVVMAEGEESRGYKVLSIDDEGSVRLRGPDGSELTLPPSSF